jgi:hypothetical protein
METLYITPTQFAVLLDFILEKKKISAIKFLREAAIKANFGGEGTVGLLKWAKEICDDFSDRIWGVLDASYLLDGGDPGYLKDALRYASIEVTDATVSKLLDDARFATNITSKLEAVQRIGYFPKLVVVSSLPDMPGYYKETI